MAKHFKDDHLFEQLKQSPAELSLDEVNKMIEAFPLTEVGHDGNGTADASSIVFSVKAVLFITIPLLIAAGVFFFKSSDSKSTTQLNSNQAPAEEVLKVSQEELSILSTTNELVDVKTDNKRENIKAQASRPQLQSSESIKRLRTQINWKKSIDKINMPFIKVNRRPRVVNSPNILPKSKRSTGFFQTVDQTFEEPSFIPDLSNREMKKLKRVLYRHLVDDKLVFNNETYVEISLLRDGIIINDVVLGYDQYLKYKDITRKVGVGHHRKIKMDPEFIQLGDFTDEGFKGSGLGTFSFTSAKKLSDSKISEKESGQESEIKKELNELDDFSEQIINGEDAKSGIRLRSINLNMEACKDVHQQLYDQLFYDRLIQSKEDFVLIELPPNAMIVNGTTLNIQLFKKYNDFLKSYKIRHGAKRQIRMSSQTISIGDFSPGEFTGTRTTF